MNLELKAVGGKAVLSVPASRPPWGVVLRFAMSEATPSRVVGTLDDHVPIPGAGPIHFEWCGDLASLLSAAAATEHGDAMAMLEDTRMHMWRDTDVTFEMLKESLDAYEAELFSAHNE